MNDFWAIQLKIKQSERNEKRINEIVNTLHSSLSDLSWFVTGLEATGEFGKVLSDRNYSIKRMNIVFEELDHLLNEDGQIIEMHLDCQSPNHGDIFIVVQDGFYISIINFGVSIDKDQFGDYLDENIELWKNIKS